MGAALRLPGDNPSSDEPQFFGQIPADPWAVSNKVLTDRAKVVLGGLTILARRSRTEVEASVEEIAVACGKSARSVQRGLTELVARGHLARQSSKRQFYFRFKLRGRQSTIRAHTESTPAEPDPVVDPVVYEKYLNSEAWQARRQAVLWIAGHRCQACNSDDPLDVHHRTYQRIGNEVPEDLIALCRKCHDVFHQNGRLAR